jgi:hypothetical protein
VGQALTTDGDGFAMDTITNTIPLNTPAGGSRPASRNSA